MNRAPGYSRRLSAKRTPQGANLGSTDRGTELFLTRSAMNP